MDLLEKLMSRTEKKENGCWIWHGAHSGGYGMISTTDGLKWAHRCSWELHRGPIPTGLYVCHNCPAGDNRSCINPDHLFLGTTRDNTADRHRKGRDAKGEKNGNSKITADVVRQIREKYRPDQYGSLTRLAKEYNIDPTQVLNIVRRKQWAHVM